MTRRVRRSLSAAFCLLTMFLPDEVGGLQVYWCLVYGGQRIRRVFMYIYLRRAADDV